LVDSAPFTVFDVKQLTVIIEMMNQLKLQKECTHSIRQEVKNCLNE